jgi:hypothetical protein
MCPLSITAPPGRTFQAFLPPFLLLCSCSSGLRASRRLQFLGQQYCNVTTRQSPRREMRSSIIGARGHFVLCGVLGEKKRLDPAGRAGHGNAVGPCVCAALQEVFPKRRFDFGTKAIARGCCHVVDKGRSPQFHLLAVRWSERQGVS